MANELATTEEEETLPVKKKMSGKILILFIVLPAVLLLSVGGAAAFFLLGNHSAHSAKKQDDKKKDDSKKDDKPKDGEKGADDKSGVKISTGPNGEAYITLPDMIVNISTADSRPALLDLQVTFQTKDVSTANAIKPALPRIMGQYTGFLRELRMEDIAGSAGYSRLQLELLKRVNLAVAPAQVDAVLIQKMIVN